MKHCVWIFLLFWSLGVDSYKVVKTCKLFVNSDCSIYLLSNGWAKVIENNATVLYLKHDPANLEFIPWDVFSTNYHILVNQTVPLLKPFDNTPDELTRVALLFTHVMQPKLLYDIQLIGDYVNGAVIEFKNRQLLATRDYKGIHMELTWLNSTDFPIYSMEMYYGIPVNRAHETIFTPPLVAEDMRIMKISENRFFVIYTNRFVQPYRVGTAEIVTSDYINNNSNKNENSKDLNSVTNNVTKNSGSGVKKLHLINLCPTITPEIDMDSKQKNWSPFIYNNTIMLIQRINPLHVVSFYNTTPTDCFAKTVSKSETGVKINWSYGDLRGGTNAILVRNTHATHHSKNNIYHNSNSSSSSGSYKNSNTNDTDREHHPYVYLSFFHSAGRFPDVKTRSYFFGAYTFRLVVCFELWFVTFISIY